MKTTRLEDDTQDLTNAIKALQDFDFVPWYNRLQKAAESLAKGVTDDPGTADIAGRALHDLFLREYNERRVRLVARVNQAAARVGSHAPQESCNHQQQLQGQLGVGIMTTGRQ